VSNPSDSELLRARQQALAVMKRCDELIERAETELLKFSRYPVMLKAHSAGSVKSAGRFKLASLAGSPSSSGSAANSN
jgi:hypothetical protein